VATVYLCDFKQLLFTTLRYCVRLAVGKGRFDFFVESY